MRCPNPKTTLDRGQHPCGGCIICRKNKGRFWTTRILLEDAFNPAPTWFVTLTYDDDHVPRTPEGDLTLRKKETTQWMRDQVKQHGFRYYLVGEYGDRTKRPHYHAAIFGEAHGVDKTLGKWQRRGYTDAHLLGTGSAAYLAQYTTKRLTQADDPRLETGQEPEFRTSSRDPAIGLSAIEPMACAYETESGKLVLAQRGDVERTVRIGARKWPLDNYLLSKLRKRLDIPQTHEERLAHEGYYEWHQNPEMEKDLPTLRYEEMKHAKRKKARKFSI